MMEVNVGRSKPVAWDPDDRTRPVRMHLQGGWSFLEGFGDYDDREAIYRIVDRPFSFPVKGAKFSPAFRSHRWDGKTHLVRKARLAGDKVGAIRFPHGLALEIEALLVKNEDRLGLAGKFEILDELPTSRVKPGRSDRMALAGSIVLRSYQAEAVETAIREGRGILLMPPRSGKTLTAAAIMARLGLPTLFVVSSDALLDQAIRTFLEALPGASITRIGGGEWDESGDVVVASIQTLSTRLESRQFYKFARSRSLVFFDESHHLIGSAVRKKKDAEGNPVPVKKKSVSGSKWRDAALAFQARYVFGLTATIEIDGSASNDTESIWLRGICGPVIFARSIRDMMDVGALSHMTVRWLQYDPDLDDKAETEEWSGATYHDMIAACRGRNKAIVAVAVQEARAGRSVLVDTARVQHSRDLGSEIANSLPSGKVEILTGKRDSQSAARREHVLAQFRDGSVAVVVGTVIGEGVDIPSLEVVINAEGGKVKTATLQRLRNMTAVKGKADPVIYEPVDGHHPYLARWCRARQKVYEAEEAFGFEIVSADEAIESLGSPIRKR